MPLARAVIPILAAMVLGLLQDAGCGFREEPRKGEGEPCTRASECELELECRGGACRMSGVDAGDPGDDAGAASPDAATGPIDAAISRDGSADASGG